MTKDQSIVFEWLSNADLDDYMTAIVDLEEASASVPNEVQEAYDRLEIWEKVELVKVTASNLS